MGEEHTAAEKDKLEIPDLAQFVYDGTGKFKLADYPTSCNVDPALEEQYESKLSRRTGKIAKLQEKLYADRKEGLIFMVQAMDAAGKDSLVEHVFEGLNPAFIKAHSFKAPTKDELAHDYLWRVNKALPERGMIGIFNRSHYEDLVCVRVEGYWKHYSWPERCCDMPEEEFFKNRFRQVRDYERYLYENGYRMIKIFLNVSLDEQARRFLSRIDEQRKNWKFSADDLSHRPKWGAYQKAFEDAISDTATKENPWYIIPADQKFAARLLAQEALRNTLEAMDPQYPQMSEEELTEMAACRAQLVEELGL